MGRLGEIAQAITHPHKDEPDDFDDDEGAFTPKTPGEGAKPALH